MPTRLLVAGLFYNVAKSDDDGATWQFGTLPLVDGMSLSNGGPDWTLAANGAKYLAVPSMKIGYHTGLPHDPNQVALSADGLTWQQYVIGAVNYKLSNPVWTGSKFVVIDYDSAFSSADGETWQKVSVGFSVNPNDNNLYPVLVKAGARTIAVWPNGAASKIAYSDDSGATWADCTPAGLELGVTFPYVDAATIYLASGSTIYRSTDNGATWALFNDVGATSPYTTLGPLSKFSGGLYSLPAGSQIGGDQTKVRWSSDPAATPWNSTAQSLDLYVSHKIDQVSSGAFVVGALNTADPWVQDAVLAKTTDGLAYSAIAIDEASFINTPDWFAFTDVIAEYFETSAGHLGESLTIGNSISSGAQQVFAAMLSTLGFTSLADGGASIAAAFSDRMVLFSDGSAAFPVTAAMRDTLSLSDAGRQAQGIDGPIELPTQLSLNATSKAVSLYQGYDFNQYASVGQDLYGQKADGVYLLRGDADQGEPINAAIYLGATAFGSSLTKRVESIYLAAETDGSVTVTAVADQQEFTYTMKHYGPMLRAMIGKGLQGRTWAFVFQFEGASVADIDVVEVMLGAGTRRRRTKQ